MHLTSANNSRTLVMPRGSCYAGSDNNLAGDIVYSERALALNNNIRPVGSCCSIGFIYFKEGVRFLLVVIMAEKKVMRYFKMSQEELEELAKYNLSGIACKTYLQLKLYCGSENYCYPSQTTIAKNLRTRRQTINTSIKILCETGMVVIVPGKTTSTYTLPFHHSDRKSGHPLTAKADTPDRKSGQWGDRKSGHKDKHINNNINTSILIDNENSEKKETDEAKLKAELDEGIQYIKNRASKILEVDAGNIKALNVYNNPEDNFYAWFNDPHIGKYDYSTRAWRIRYAAEAATRIWLSSPSKRFIQDGYKKAVSKMIYINEHPKAPPEPKAPVKGHQKDMYDELPF